MSKNHLAKRVQKLHEKQAQIAAQLQMVASQQRARERKQETRRKVIAGALALHHAKKNPEDAFSKKLLRLLDEYVVKDYERKLFGLPALPKEVNFLGANDAKTVQGSLKKEFHGGK